LDQLREEDKKMIDDFEESLSLIKPDMTIFFQLLISLPSAFENKESLAEYLSASFYRQPDPVLLEKLYLTIGSYQQRLSQNTISPEASKELMKANNPRFILRNYMLHQAIQEMEKGQQGLFLKLKEAMKTPYSDQHDEFFKLRPDWANDQPGSSTLSCSS
jgi:uncharacterized protein YdiU (UPF0061 family)